MYFAPDASPCAAALLLSPLFEERRAAHRAMTEFCSVVADEGVTVLHPDLTGTGNSPGALSRVTLADWAADLDAAVSFLLERAPGVPLYLVGCRCGALLAGWRVAQAPDEFCRVLLWNPVAGGRAYLAAARKRRMIQDSLTAADERPPVHDREVEGQVLSDSLFDALSGLNLAGLPRPPDLRLFQCSFNERLTPDVQRLLRAWGEDGTQVETVVAQPFWNAHTPGGYEKIVVPARELLLR